MLKHGKAMVYMWVADVLGAVDDVLGHRWWLCQETERWFDKAHSLYYNGDKCQYDACASCGKNVAALSVIEPFEGCEMCETRGMYCGGHDSYVCECGATCDACADGCCEKDAV